MLLFTIRQKTLSQYKISNYAKGVNGFVIKKHCVEQITVTLYLVPIVVLFHTFHIINKS